MGPALCSSLCVVILLLCVRGCMEYYLVPIRRHLYALLSAVNKLRHCLYLHSRARLVDWDRQPLSLDFASA